MKKTIKVLFILIIVISITNISFAAPYATLMTDSGSGSDPDETNSEISSSSNYSISNIFTDAQNFVQSGNTVGSMINTNALKNTSSFIYKTLFSIGMVVAVAVGIVLGIQFMVASAEDKAKIKETLIAYVVGCIVLFGAYGIWRVVVELVKKTTTI